MKKKFVKMQLKNKKTDKNYVTQRRNGNDLTEKMPRKYIKISDVKSSGKAKK